MKFLLRLFVILAGFSLLTWVPAAAAPFISSVSNPITIGNPGRFMIHGSGFSPGSRINFFVATASGARNYGPLTPTSQAATSLTVPADISSIALGEGVAAVQVVNIDEQFAASNLVFAQLVGDRNAGIPTIATIDGAGIAPISLEPDYAVQTIDTVLPLGGRVTITGSGFDTRAGV